MHKYSVYLLFVDYKSFFVGIGAALLNGDIPILPRPFGYIGVVRALGGLGVNVFGVFNMGSTIGAHVAKLTILTNIYLIL